MLSPSRQKALVNGLTSVARKVFDAVPISEAWTVQQIQTELNRVSSLGRDFHTVRGCLHSLTECGLITQPEKDTTFRRVALREPIPNEVATPQVPRVSNHTKPQAPATSAPAKKSPITILSDLATQMRSLADEIEHAALEIEESFSASEADNAKLKQLQTLLRSIGLGN